MTEMKIRELFSKNLKRIRSNQRISQLVLADMTELTHTFINDIENCKKWISPDSIAKLCNALNVEPFQFFLSNDDFDENNKKVFSTCVDDLSSLIMNSVNDFKTEYGLNDKPDDDEVK
jgi:transcriptional regulator with XRE-family HTH domain